MQDKITVAIADAHFLSRYGLRKILDGQGTFDIVGEVNNEKSLLQLVRLRSPQMLIIDYYHPEAFSEDSIIKVKKLSPNTHILVISGVQNKASIYQVLEKGINSFLTKNCGKTEVIDAIRATSRGEKFFCTRVLDYLLEKSFSSTSPTLSNSSLTTRETEIVGLVVQGLTAKEIEKQLNLSTHTVYTHRKNIMKKLNLNTSSELVLYAVRNGLASNIL